MKKAVLVLLCASLLLQGCTAGKGIIIGGVAGGLLMPAVDEEVDQMIFVGTALGAIVGGLIGLLIGGDEDRYDGYRHNSTHEGYYFGNSKYFKEKFVIAFNSIFRNYSPRILQNTNNTIFAVAKYGRSKVEAELLIVSDDTYKLSVISDYFDKSNKWKNNLIKLINNKSDN
jgi:hypothetical protein